jgi:peroxiredoxin
MKQLVALAGFAFFSSMALAVSPFSLPWENSTDGTATYSSADHRGDIFVVENYFLDCPYCNDNAPNIDKIASQFSSNTRVQVLDVGVDTDDSSYQEWINRHHPNHPVLKDADQSLSGQLGTQGYPTTYVLDSNLNVVYSHEGEFESGTATEVTNAIGNLLNNKLKASPAPRR